MDALDIPDPRIKTVLPSLGTMLAVDFFLRFFFKINLYAHHEV